MAQNPQNGKCKRHRSQKMITPKQRTHKPTSVINIEPMQLYMTDTESTKFYETENQQTQCDRLGTHIITCDDTEPIQLCVTYTETMDQQV